jgi:hypothetical protein
MDQHRKEARETLSEQVRKLHTEPCELSTVVTELRQMLAAERAKVLNLPPLPSVRQAKVGFRGQTRSICSVFETPRV